MKKCTHCQTTNSDIRTICSHCGASLPDKSNQVGYDFWPNETNQQNDGED